MITLIVPARLEAFEAKLRPRLDTQAVNNSPHFPFASHASFLEAVKQERVCFSMSRDVHLFWQLCDQHDSIPYLACAYCGYILALGFALVALLAHNYWLMLSVPVLCLSSFCATPGPSCGQGCLPALAGLPCCYVGLTSHPSLAFAGFFWLYVWLLASFGVTVIMEVALEACKQSEIILVWAVVQGMVSFSASSPVEDASDL